MDNSGERSDGSNVWPSTTTEGISLAYHKNSVAHSASDTSFKWAGGWHFD